MRAIPMADVDVIGQRLLYEVHTSARHDDRHWASPDTM